ncbi:MAG: site-specific DNA-methyltransferase [Planctomycetota bacterium]|nr:MAG: site-specific DNA-methyltransferase [Planctomycetota bacterium]
MKSQPSKSLRQKNKNKKEVLSKENNSGISPKNKLNDLTGKEWLPETISVWTQRGLGAKHPDAQIEKEHPAPFSFTDVGRLIKFFTKKGQVVLDPFVGIGSTLKACAINGRRGIGIELNAKYVDLTKKRLQKELEPNLFPYENQVVLEGDCREILNKLEENSADFIVTSPPYWNILHKEDHKAKQERINQNLDTKYGNDTRDLGNINSYRDFLRELIDTFKSCIRVLKPNKYMAIIVSDFRNKSKYHMFHADLANGLEKTSLKLKGITILYQPFKKIFPYGYPAAFVPNIHHQYILIIQNTKKVQANRAKGKRK